MEQQSSHFVAMPVFSLEDGQQIGTVKEVVIDNKALEISALVIEPKGFFKEQKIIPYVKVKNVGADAITIERGTNASTSTSFPNILSLMKNNNTIIGTKVITENGITLGYIEEFLVDDATGKITAFELGGKISRLLNGTVRFDACWALTLGKDALIAKTGAEKELIKTSAPLKDSFNSFSNTTAKWFDDAFDNTKKWGKNIGEKLSRVAAEEMPSRFKKKEEPDSLHEESKEEAQEPHKNDTKDEEELF